MEDTERMALNKQIGFLQGLAWAACADDKMQFFSEAIDAVVAELTKLMD